MSRRKKLNKNNKEGLDKKLDEIKQEVLRVLGSQKNSTQIIRNENELHNYISSCIDSGIIAIDTETNNSLDPLTCEMMGLCIYGPNLKQAYVPLNHRDPVSKRKLPYQLNYENIANELNRLKEANTIIVMHNGKFDYEVIKCTCNIDIVPNWDTMIAARVLEENEPAALKWQYAHKINTDQEVYKIDKLFKGVNYADVEIDIFALYSAHDALMTYELYEYQVKQFNKEDNQEIYKLFKEIEMPMIQIVGDMELIGVKADLGYVQRLKNKYQKKLEEKNEEIFKLYDKFKELVDEWKKSANAQRNDLLEPKNADLKKDDYEKKFDIQNDIKGIRNKLGKRKIAQLSDPIKITSSKQLSIFFYDVIGAANVKTKRPRGTGKDEVEQLKENFNSAITYLKHLKKLPEEPTNEEEEKEIRATYACLRRCIRTNFEYNDIDKVISKCENAIEFIELLLEYREYSKLITTYLNNVPKLSKHWPDGKIRFHLNSYGADTGRFSSGGGWKFLENDEPTELKGMNQQNLPSKNHEIRLSFCADEGRAFVSGDFSSQEPKITAYVSQDYEMIRAFKEKRDIYAELAASAFGNRYEDNLEWFPEGHILNIDGNKYVCGYKDKINEEGKARRKIGKTIFLAICYGMGPASLAKKIRQKDESSGVAFARAEEMLKKVFERFKGAANAIERSKEMCKIYGFTTGLKGRRRRLPDIKRPHYEAYIFNKKNLKGNEDILIKQYLSRIEETGKDFLTNIELEKLNNEAIKNNIVVYSNEAIIKRAERQCFNSIVQGSAATMTKKTMIMIYNDQFLKKLDAHLVFQIHDELLMECPDENKEKVEKRLQYLMEHSVDMLEMEIPMSCDMEVEHRWGTGAMTDELRSDYQSYENKGSKTPFDDLCNEYSGFPKEAIERIINNPALKLEFPITEEEIIEEEVKKSSAVDNNKPQQTEEQKEQQVEEETINKNEEMVGNSINLASEQHIVLSQKVKDLIIKENNDFKEEQYGNLSKEERKKLGAFFTPGEIVIKMIEKFKWEGLKGRNILDPCCGSGNLLAGVLIAGADSDKILGNEINEEMVELCRKRLNKICDMLGKPHIQDWQIHVGNALSSEALIEFGPEYCEAQEREIIELGARHTGFRIDNRTREEYKGRPKALKKYLEKYGLYDEPSLFLEEEKTIEELKENKHNNDELDKEKRNKKENNKSQGEIKLDRKDISFRSIINDILDSSDHMISFFYNEEEHICKIENEYLVIESTRVGGKSIYKIPIPGPDYDDFESKDNLIKVILNVTKLRAEPDYSKMHPIDPKRAAERVKKAIEKGEIEVEDIGR